MLQHHHVTEGIVLQSETDFGEKSDKYFLNMEPHIRSLFVDDAEIVNRPYVISLLRKKLLIVSALEKTNEQLLNFHKI